MDPEAGEEVLFHGHPSWLSMRGLYVKGLLVAIAAGAIAGGVTAVGPGRVQVSWVILTVLVVFAIVLLTGFLRRLSTTYTITNQRLTIRAGVLTRDLHQTRLERVQNVNSRQSVWERIFGIGRVDFETAGEAGYNFSFDGVAHPHEIVHTVDVALRRREARTGL